MPDLIDDLRHLRGPDQPPSAHAGELGLTRLQQEIELELRPNAATRRRHTPALIAGAAAAIAVAVAVGAALLPSRGPGARTILERAAAAVSPDRAQIIIADIQGSELQGSSRDPVHDYGTARVWVRQVPGPRTQEFRSLQLDTASPGGPQRGDETASHPAARDSAGDEALSFTTETYQAKTNRLSVEPGTKTEAVPELFRARSLLAKARADQDIELDEGANVNGSPAYKLTWKDDTSRTRNRVMIEMTLWIDRDTYAPLQFTDHSHGLDVYGKPVDQTYKATVTNFQQLPDTPDNRQLLRMSAHPDARSTHHSNPTDRR